MKEDKGSIEELDELDDFELEDKGSSIDWVGLTKKLIAMRTRIFISVLCGAVLGCIVALSMPKKYTVGVSLSPEMPSSAKAGSSFVGMAASILGSGLGQGGPDAVNAMLAPNIVGSTPFMLDLLNSHVVSQDGKIDTTLSAYLDQEKGSVIGYVKQVPGMIMSEIRSLYQKKLPEAGGGAKSNVIHLSLADSKKIGRLREQIVVNVDKSTITSITVTLQDPKIAAVIADSVVSKLQQTIIQYRISKAQEDVKYWEQIYQERQEEYYKAQQRYADYVDAHTNLVYQSTLVEKERLQNDMNLALEVYSQVAQQLQMARAKVQEDKPAFTILEPSVVPLYPSSTSRVAIFLAMVVLCVVLTIAWAFWGSQYLADFKQNFWYKLKN